MTSEFQDRKSITNLRTHAEVEKERKEAVSEIFQLNQIIEDTNKRIEEIWEYLKSLDQQDLRISESYKKRSYPPDLV